MAVLGLLVYRAIKGKGSLAEMLTRASTAASSSGGVGGLLDGLFGAGTAGSVLSSGLADLIKQFQQSGQGEAAASWVSTGPNNPLSGEQVEQTLGPERIAWLLRETRLSREKLLAGLTKELPLAVDELTPDGRIPTEKEAAHVA
jgi:uncharacterized protein YidB (DUF937 family)